MRDRLFIALQHLLPQHLLSRRRVLGSRASRAPDQERADPRFMRGFNPDMSDAVEPNPLAYPSFNEFFTRALRPARARSTRDADDVVSPVDGTVSQIGRLDARHAAAGEGPRLFARGSARRRCRVGAHVSRRRFATLYLAPYNYHRIHMPLAGTLRAAWYVPGDLFSVNAVTAAAVPVFRAQRARGLRVRERAAGLFAMVLVGALFVGSMTTVWHGDITPRSPRRARRACRTDASVPAARRRGDGPIQHGLDRHPAVCARRVAGIHALQSARPSGQALGSAAGAASMS